MRYAQTFLRFEWAVVGLEMRRKLLRIFAFIYNNVYQTKLYNRLMQRLLLFLLLAATTLGAAGKSFKFTYKDVTFNCKTIDDNSVCITSFTAGAPNVVIPARVTSDGRTYLVKEVDTFVNGNNYLARTLVLEDGIEKIAASAFIEFRKLKSVTLPASVKYVGRNAFRSSDDTRFTLPPTLSEYALRSRKEIDILGEQNWEAQQALKAEKAKQKEEQRLLAAAEKARQESIAAENRRADELRKIEEARQKEEARLAEKKRKEEEARLARQAREAEEARRRDEAEAARLAEQARKAEQDSIAEVQRQIAAAEKARQDSIAAEARKAEELRKAEEARQKEEARLAEKKRKEEEALLAKQAREAEKQRKEEEKRRAEEERKAEERRKFVADSIANEERRIEMARKEKEENARREEARLLFDVDQNIPTGPNYSSNTYCVIIANEEYMAEGIDNVRFAINDGKVFKQYCTKTLGIPESNIRLRENASYGTIIQSLEFLKQAAFSNSGKVKLIFYYAGHGMPSESTQRACLLPTDASPKIERLWIPLNEVYSELSSIESESVTVFLDACFSGRKRGNDEAMMASRGAAMKVMDEPLKGNMVVFSAVSNEETALSFEEKKHGMFTYFLLNQLNKSRGNISYGKLFKEVEEKVKRYSWKRNLKSQTPTVTTSPAMHNAWQQLKF
mgnify:CR=1 FL=1